ncbi:Extracellular serine/threonine protein kinase four-jointed [Blattella germanica]|nr:Extracellular serine/threonine protein kinase four-jointed [Blattella germanica]PSN40108.1 Extracellular serine/threonine protein kinase four-jointed [Blattella germanica]
MLGSSATMCEQQLVEHDDNNKRRRNKAHHLVMSLNQFATSPSGGSVVRTSPYRTLCLLTAGLAFILGLVVGVMIPLYVLPRGEAPLHRNLSRVGNVSDSRVLRPRRSNFSVQVRNATEFPSVSFVVKAPSVAVLHSVAPTPEQMVDGLIEGGVYWSRRVEDALPTGFEESEADSWRRFARKTPVVKVEEGCGRMQNRLLTFEDGTRSCCRYRQNTDQIQGELFSFYLGRLLGLRNLAPSSLALVRLRDPLWSRVRPQLSLAQWNEERAVVLTRFVPSLEPAHIPTSLRTSARRLHPPDILSLKSDAPEVVELAQWSDLIVFDYLTANLDRVVNNLYNLQWNPAMMDAPAHNLARESNSGLLVFFDNESGLLHGYRLLDKYELYHGALLEALCVFRKSTADVIKKLHKDKNVGVLLHSRFEDSDPEFRDFLPSLPDKSIKILNERIDRVHEQIKQCERLYAT